MFYEQPCFGYLEPNSNEARAARAALAAVGYHYILDYSANRQPAPRSWHGMEGNLWVLPRPVLNLAQPEAGQDDRGLNARERFLKTEPAVPVGKWSIIVISSSQFASRSAIRQGEDLLDLLTDKTSYKVQPLEKGIQALETMSSIRVRCEVIHSGRIHLRVSSPKEKPEDLSILLFLPRDMEVSKVITHQLKAASIALSRPDNGMIRLDFHGLDTSRTQDFFIEPLRDQPLLEAGMAESDQPVIE
jgi:hypothetical protein